MSDFTPEDCDHMAHALRLAEHGRYTAHPNPMVGCVIVNNRDVVGDGWHVATGEAHAEVNALERAGPKARNATAYVTLEPCSHHGSTPPCTDALIAAGVTRVVAAIEDPNRAVAGGGAGVLRDAGIGVQVGLMQSAATDLIRGYLKRVSVDRPLLRIKMASSLDGSVAMANGESQWITGPEARADVQRLRAGSGAVLTGVNTVISDDPSLNVRAENIDMRGRQPLRVVLDATLRMPATAKMLSLPGETLVCCIARNASAEALERAGAEVLVVDDDGGKVDIDAVLAELAMRGVNDVLVEAGPKLCGYLMENHLVDELVIYQAPHIMGSETKGLVQTPTWTSLSDRKMLNIVDTRRVGADFRITARLNGMK